MAREGRTGKRVMNSIQTCNSVTFYFMKNSFSDVSRKWILPDMIRAGIHVYIFEDFVDE